jgi:hypothetical protein
MVLGDTLNLLICCLKMEGVAAALTKQIERSGTLT